MAGLLNNLFGGQKPSPSPGHSADDADFADFAGAPDPSPASISPLAASPASDQSVPTSSTLGPSVPYTAWYRVWERTSPSDFKLEAMVIPFIVLAMIVHIWGRKRNARVASRWGSVHTPTLLNEFSLVGFGGRKSATLDDVNSAGLAKTVASGDLDLPEELIKEKSAQEFISYASGRKNVAFVDIKLKLLKRFNPVGILGEHILSLFFDSFPPPSERAEAVLYPFDSREADLVPVPGGAQAQEALEQRKKGPSTTYDNFVWAVVHKDGMKRYRDDRYDLSLTTTRDHAKLPQWLTVMSESAEITDFMLDSALIDAVTKAGESFDYLIVTDQPLDKPTKLDEAVSKKRIHFSYRLGSSVDAEKDMSPIFSYFLRLSDRLVASAHFRPEVMRKVRATRETQVRKLRKADEEEEAEERATKKEKEKKEKREALLKGLSADEQRKFLDKEREKDQRKNQKKITSRG
ncbi:MAG: hypothetical protein M4579_004463 [Chaenotheca gracillima]|nr:MAG: hypothetical protein M4579_004463 [Chaenotheca gracillima]